ncbi:lantibiotic immunity ABC transporter MutG family permease subunit [Globicatella sulfidifaciens]|uniref:lantibiotic immunity ABC transporter MutG family permease subunit n=1 Tax=Globicatella sulfidifaciens TaxID=136093 RepID=UPI00288CC027|nr:lantibiotic immunity ABC transporter MutG family permease subunit [Globicatella sulfidifaciens]MDT2768760.1 lantibiotic immunity ABC transporter MutG family permease subunit [Globicatella sulfidifaciens]
MINIIKSEIYKIKGTWLPWIHIVLPIAYSLLFYVASKTTGLKNFEENDISQTYFVLLGAVIPIILSFITSKVVDMEMSAGKFQVLLSTTKSRSKAYIGKLLVLELGFVISLALAIIIFAILTGYQNILDWLIEFFLIVISSLSLYMIHLWVSIVLSNGASIGFGFLETMIALLSMTVIGDNIWYFIPCTWGARLPAMYIRLGIALNPSYFYKELRLWGLIASFIILILFISSIIWFNKWDGKSVSE